MFPLIPCLLFTSSLALTLPSLSNTNTTSLCGFPRSLDLSASHPFCYPRTIRREVVNRSRCAVALSFLEAEPTDVHYWDEGEYTWHDDEETCMILLKAVERADNAGTAEKKGDGATEKSRGGLDGRGGLEAEVLGAMNDDPDVFSATDVLATAESIFAQCDRRRLQSQYFAHGGVSKLEALGAAGRRWAVFVWGRQLWGNIAEEGSGCEEAAVVV